MQTNHKALSTELLLHAASVYSSEFSQDEIAKVKNNPNVVLTERVLKHRFIIGPGTGIKKLLGPNTKRVIGVTDFENQKPAVPGLYFINSIMIATTDEVDKTLDDDGLSKANFKSAITANDAALQSGRLIIKVVGSDQPDIEVYIGDVMPKTNPQFTRGAEYFLSQGFFIPTNKNIQFELDFFEDGVSRFADGKSKAMEISLVGMKAVL